MTQLPTSGPLAAHGEGDHDDILYPEAIPFVLVHVACLGALWTGVSATSLLVCAALYVVRMFGVTAGYHRYFSHRSYRTGRVVQFLLAVLCQMSAQKSVLWWAAKHRHHHKHADTELDVHSPGQHGFWHAHVGWIFRRQHDGTDLDAVPDLARYPELRWLDRHQLVPAVGLGVLVWLLLGWEGLVVGFFWSTVLLYHGTFAINSMAHVWGRQRYVTGDDSRNNWLLALITLGEGWHNNHHAYMSSTRQGFRWWEIDPTWYALKVLSWLRVVRDLRDPPAAVLRGEHRLGTAVVEKVARQLAVQFPVERIAQQAREALGHAPTVAELRERARSARAQAEAALAEWLQEVHLPAVPTLDEVRQAAARSLAHTPSLDDIARRARALVAAHVAFRLLEAPEPA